MYLVKKIRKTTLLNDTIQYSIIGYTIQRIAPEKIALIHCPRIKTPYGIAPDLHIRENGNDTCSLALWSTGQTLAENISKTRARQYLKQHYINLFRKEGKWWNFYHTSYEAAEQQAINLWAQTLNITQTQAREQFLQQISRDKKSGNEKDMSLQRQQEKMATGYENMFTVDPGETFKQSLRKAKLSAPHGMPFQQIVAITHVIRRNYYDSKI